MGGGLIQLAASGYENLYFTIEPEITFFKTVYKRHTNFSQELIPQLFTTTPDFGKRVTCKISKNGDLLNNMFLYIEIPNIPKFINDNDESCDCPSYKAPQKLIYYIQRTCIEDKHIL